MASLINRQSVIAEIAQSLEVTEEETVQRLANTVCGLCTAIRDAVEDPINGSEHSGIRFRKSVSILSHFFNPAFGDQAENSLSWVDCRKMVAARSGQQLSEQEFDEFLEGIRAYFCEKPAPYGWNIVSQWV